MKIIIINIAFVFVLISCGGGGDSEEPIPTAQKNPVAALLTFPEKNSECATGTNITVTSSTIVFKWNTSLNTDSYELVLKNLETAKITTHSTNTNQLSIELLRGTPYSWFIKSKSNSSAGTAKSETWKFYNAGEATVSYAPFPAELTSPANNSDITTAIVTLDWKGSDVDNDIDSYDVYFGTSSTPSLFESGKIDSQLTNVAVSAGSTYYWNIISKDEQGNSSTSEVFKFTVN